MTRPLAGLAAVPIDQLHPSPHNPREHLTDLGPLALSIKESGLLQPIVVQAVPGEQGYRILAGHRRHAAARKLGWREVPVIIRRDMLPDDELVAMIAENGQRANLDPIEEARAFQRLRQAGFTQQEIAAKVGRSIAHVSTRIGLLALPVEDQERIRAGDLAISAGVREARVAVARSEGRAVNTTATRGWHFARDHALADQARELCTREGHAKGRRLTGGVACGACWERVVRDDERALADNDHACRDVDAGLS